MLFAPNFSVSVWRSRDHCQSGHNSPFPNKISHQRNRKPLGLKKKKSFFHNFFFITLILGLQKKVFVMLPDSQKSAQGNKLDFKCVLETYS